MLLEFLVWPAVVIICTIILSVAASLICSERVELERERDVREHSFASERARERTEQLGRRAEQQAAQMEALQVFVETLAPVLGRLLGDEGPRSGPPSGWHAAATDDDPVDSDE